MEEKSLLNHNAQLRCAAGNGVLEMLLCTPLALLFIFVAIDGGLSHLERQALVNALHTGVVDGARFLQHRSLFEVGTDNLLVLNRDEARTLIDGIAQAVDAHVQNAKGHFLTNGSTTNDYKIVISAFEFPVDTSTGTVIGSSSEAHAVATAVWPDVEPGFDLHQAIPNFPIISSADFIERELAAEPREAPSRFAIPLGVTYRADDPTAAHANFLDKTLVVYAELTSLPNGTNPAFAQSTLGQFYGLELQELLSARTLLK